MASKTFEDKTLELLGNMAVSLASIAATLDDMNVNGVTVVGPGAYISPYDEDEEPPDYATTIDRAIPEKKPDE